ncbi:hypothetical protein CEP52_017326 [Fusarium oligoseptatum]|uniref:Uncharacterized protein n=1 Tax=Fusarium oligoseptatum TaxID=2604345 RepID=A0A428RT76_9HYPO|nr:hypothetical protein CEP52_017326 [Fusarium oligoseptatum]
MPDAVSQMDESTEVMPEADEDQTITENAVPAPDVDVTQTMQWLSIASPNLLDVTSLVILNNLEVLATRIQSVEKMQVDNAQQIRKAIKLLEQLGGQTSRRSSLTGSRRSSVGSRRSSTGQPPEEDKAVHPFELMMEDPTPFDDVFERFILASSHAPLVRRSKHVQAASTAFVEAVNGELGGYLDEAATAQLSSLNDDEKIDFYINLSKRHRSNKTKGKQVVTVTESFHTDIVGGTDSQSTQANTPRDRPSKKTAPKTPARRTRSRQVIMDSGDEEGDMEGDGDNENVQGQ